MSSVVRPPRNYRADLNRTIACGKFQYRSVWEAYRVMKKVLKRNGKGMKDDQCGVYRCPHCGSWHWTGRG